MDFFLHTRLCSTIFQCEFYEITVCEKITQIIFHGVGLSPILAIMLFLDFSLLFRLCKENWIVLLIKACLITYLPLGTYMQLFCCQPNITSILMQLKVLMFNFYQRKFNFNFQMSLCCFNLIKKLNCPTYYTYLLFICIFSAASQIETSILMQLKVLMFKL